MLHNAHEMPSIVSALFLIQFCLNHLLRHPAVCPPHSFSRTCYAVPCPLCVLLQCALVETCPSVSSPVRFPQVQVQFNQARISLESFYILLPSLPGIGSGATCHQFCQYRVREKPAGSPLLLRPIISASIETTTLCHSRRPRETSAFLGPPVPKTSPISSIPGVWCPSAHNSVPLLLDFDSWTFNLHLTTNLWGLPVSGL